MISKLNTILFCFYVKILIIYSMYSMYMYRVSKIFLIFDRDLSSFLKRNIFSGISCSVYYIKAQKDKMIFLIQIFYDPFHVIWDSKKVIIWQNKKRVCLKTKYNRFHPLPCKNPRCSFSAPFSKNELVDKFYQGTF